MINYIKQVLFGDDEWEEPKPRAPKKPNIHKTSKKTSTISINGKVFSGSHSIKVKNGDVYIDGKLVCDEPKSGPLVINITGGLLSLEADGAVNCGDVYGNISAGGSVNANDVNGKVSAGGSVSCREAYGGIIAGGNVSTRR